MENFTILVPSIKNDFNLKTSTKEIKDFLKQHKVAAQILFVLPAQFKKPSGYKLTKDTSLLQVEASTLGALIKEGLKTLDKEAVLILDIKKDFWKEAAQKIIEQKNSDNIVRVKIVKTKEKKEKVLSKINKIFNNIFTKIYFWYLKALGLPKDLLLDKTIQYFCLDAVQIINSLPQKSAQLRNFDTLVGFEDKQVIVELDKLQKETPSLSQILPGAIIGALGILAIITTFIFREGIFSLNSGLAYFMFSIVIFISAILFGGYLVVRAHLKLLLD